MLAWLAYQVPWQFWAALGGLVIGGLLSWLHLFVGWRAALEIGVALAAAIGAAVALNRQGQIGYKARIKQEKDAADAQQAHWDSIDGQPLAPDDAYQQLRDRAAKAGK